MKDCRAEIAKPIAFIINLSLQTAIVPTEWKTALITPIHKSGNTTEANNFRPISVLPVISKILEKAVQQQLVEYLETNHHLSDSQFGYRKKRSTKVATTLFIDNLRKACHKGLVSGALFIDLSKAFDTLGHANLLLKLESTGVKGLALNWFRDYLFGRKQIVKYNNELSDPTTLLCGVPQGSILGPILFLIFFDDFEKCLQNCKTIQFADDTVIYISEKSIAEVQTKLNEDLAQIASYLQTNELIINLKKGKTEGMLVGTSKRLANDSLSELELHFRHEKINCTTEYKYLGTEIDQNLNLNKNFDQKVKKASVKLHLLKRLMSFLTQDAAITVYKSYILPILKYNCLIQLNLTRTQKDKLATLVSRAENIIQQDIPSIEQDFYRHSVKMVQKCLHGDVCSNLTNYFQMNNHLKVTRNRDLLIRIPKVKLETAKSGFFFMGAKLYNTLPREIRQSGDDFFKKLETFEFEF